MLGLGAYRGAQLDREHLQKSGALGIPCHIPTGLEVAFIRQRAALQITAEQAVWMVPLESLNLYRCVVLQSALL